MVDWISGSRDATIYGRSVFWQSNISAASVYWGPAIICAAYRSEETETPLGDLWVLFSIEIRYVWKHRQSINCVKVYWAIFHLQLSLYVYILILLPKSSHKMVSFYIGNGISVIFIVVLLSQTIFFYYTQWCWSYWSGSMITYAFNKGLRHFYSI